MTLETTRRTFNHPLALGVASIAFCFAFSWVFWPLWALSAKALILTTAATGLAQVPPAVAAKFGGLFADATFFWIVIVAWIWQWLIFGGYGRTWLTDRQPWAGLWYSGVALLTGIAGFLVLVALPGLWWKPFSLGILFASASAAEVKLALEGWEASNFYSLACIVVQAGYVAIFQKWPFAGKIEAPWDGFGAMMTSTVFALLFWFAMIIPGLMDVSVTGQAAVTKPFGSFASFIAFCQGFILVSLIPAEGGERFPGSLFSAKQPVAGFATFVLALAAGFLLPPLLRPVVVALDLLPTAPADLVVASLVLSVIVVMLLWHHLFDDYPGADRVRSRRARVTIRIAIWIVAGGVYGVVWLKAYTLVPWGANDLGFGVPGAGVLAGQFVFLTLALWFNTFFGKWPLVRRPRDLLGAGATSATLPGQGPTVPRQGSSLTAHRRVDTVLGHAG